jgi:hypothetical protein
MLPPDPPKLILGRSSHHVFASHRSLHIMSFASTAQAPEAASRRSSTRCIATLRRQASTPRARHCSRWVAGAKTKLSRSVSVSVSNLSVIQVARKRYARKSAVPPRHDGCMRMSPSFQYPALGFRSESTGDLELLPLPVYLKSQ